MDTLLFICIYYMKVNRYLIIVVMETSKFSD